MLRLYNFARVYVNNVVVYSSNLEKHLRHLNELFNLFKCINIVIKSSKIFLDYLIIALFNRRSIISNLLWRRISLRRFAIFSFLKRWSILRFILTRRVIYASTCHTTRKGLKFFKIAKHVFFVKNRSKILYESDILVSS